MNIEIKSKIDFDENTYDIAFGLAKRLLINNKQSLLKRKNNIVYIAKMRKIKVTVNIFNEV